jgi:hypothetical protein
VNTTFPVGQNVVILKEAAIDLRQVGRRGGARSRELRPQPLDPRVFQTRVGLRRLVTEDIDVQRPRGESPERGDHLFSPVGVGGADAERAKAASVGDGGRQRGRADARYRREGTEGAGRARRNCFTTKTQRTPGVRIGEIYLRNSVPSVSLW